jgi:gluconolactonase
MTVLVLIGQLAGESRTMHAAEELFRATPLTQPGEFTGGIEGPACGRDGEIYAVNFAKEQTIGRVMPDGRGEVWVTLPGNSVGNGIVFDRAGTMFVADYVGHNVLKVDVASRAVTVLAHEATMNQPNDLAIAPDETIYASDPNWPEKTGQIWMVTPAGKISRVAEGLGTTNGIEVSPDGQTLYVNESLQRRIWQFRRLPDGQLTDRKLFKEFPDHGFDGMRCDAQGNLYVTRYGKGTVAILTPQAEQLREVDVLGAKPSNLCFGGPDGKTVYVTEVEHTRLVQFRVDIPGLAWQRWQSKK